MKLSLAVTELRHAPGPSIGRPQLDETKIADLEIDGSREFIANTLRALADSIAPDYLTAMVAQTGVAE